MTLAELLRPKDGTIFLFHCKENSSLNQIHSLSNLSQNHYFSEALHTAKSIIVKAKLLPKKVFS